VRAPVGESTPAISRRLAITENTVKTHLTRVYRKTGSRNRVQAARHYSVRHALPTQGHGSASLIREQIQALQARRDHLTPSLSEAERLRPTLDALRTIKLD
jgi:hypothetical protein